MMRRLLALKRRVRDAVLLGGLLAGEARAQAIVLKGTVRDSSTGRAVAGAIVEFRNTVNLRSTRTDEAGEFRFRDVAMGEATLTVRRIGYAALQRAVQVSDAPVVLDIVPSVQRLAPVRVGAKGEGIYGVVVSQADFRPIPGAKVFVAGGGTSVLTDSAGQYFIQLKRPGSYVLRVTARGFAEDILPLEVKKDQVEEASRALEASNASPTPGGMWIDFDERLRLRGRNSSVAPGSELRRAGGWLMDAAMASPSFMNRGLRFAGPVCVFLNGSPRPGLSVEQISVDDIDVVELYADDKWDRAVTELKKTWPRGVPCTSTRLPWNGAPLNGVVRWAVVWLKR